MLTILWRIKADQEEIFETYGVSKIPAGSVRGEGYDCGGNAHIAFQSLTAIEDDKYHLVLNLNVIDKGEVFVMNSEGKTIATYRF